MQSKYLVLFKTNRWWWWWFRWEWLCFQRFWWFVYFGHDLCIQFHIYNFSNLYNINYFIISSLLFISRTGFAIICLVRLSLCLSPLPCFFLDTGYRQYVVAVLMQSSTYNSKLGFSSFMHRFLHIRQNEVQLYFKWIIFKYFWMDVFLFFIICGR